MFLTKKQPEQEVPKQVRVTLSGKSTKCVTRPRLSKGVVVLKKVKDQVNVE